MASLLNRNPNTVDLSQTTSIHPCLLPGECLNAEVFVANRSVGSFQYQASREGLRRRPAFDFALPAGASRLSIKGHVQRTDGCSSLFSRRWQLLDIASLSAPLYALGQYPLAQCIVAFALQLGQLQRRSGGAYVCPVQVQSVCEQPSAMLRAVAAAGIQLPAAASDLAGLRIKVDSACLYLPHRISTVNRALRDCGLFGTRGSDHELSQWLSPSTRARYQRSLLMFAYRGQTMSMLAWDPEDVVAGEPTHCASDLGEGGAVPTADGRGVWFWLHEDSIDEPELLLERDRTPSSAVTAILSIFQRYCYAPMIDYLLERADPNDDVLVVDTAHPAAMLRLDLDDSGARPQLQLLSYDRRWARR